MDCTAGVHTEQNDELEATSSSQSVVKTLFDGNIMHPLHHSFNSVKQNKAKRIEYSSNSRTIVQSSFKDPGVSSSKIVCTWFLH